MKAILLRLESQQIAATWPKVEKWVARACRRSNGRYLAEDVRQACESGDWQLWIAMDNDGFRAVGASHFSEYPRLKAFTIAFGAARDYRDMDRLADEMCAWGKSQGATLFESKVSRGWRRLLPWSGWKHTHDFLERKS